jgi:hypothetical protein
MEIPRAEPPKEEAKVPFDKVEDCPEHDRSCLLFGCPREVNDSIIQDKFAKDKLLVASIKNKLLSIILP